MQRITNGEFIQKLLDAEEYVISADLFSGQPVLTTRTYMKDSRYGAAIEEQFIAQNPLDVSHEEFVAFHLELKAIMNGYRKPRILIGYKIGDSLYHPDDVELVYAYNDAKSQPDAAPVKSGTGTPERKHPERRSGDWEDEDSDGVLRNTGALG